MVSPAARPRVQVRQEARPRLTTPRLSVIIVNYRQWPNTAALVRQVLRTAKGRRGDVEVVVVDNHSPAHPMASRLRRWAGVSLRRWGRNRGFAQAVNEGCRLGRGGWCLLLNPDITLTDGFLESVLQSADEIVNADPRAGIIGFHLRNADGSRQLSAGPYPTLRSTLVGLLRPRARRKYFGRRLRARTRVPWVTGCCLLVRRECLADLGGLDEDFFLYYEDVDLCRRATARGWSVWYEPRARAIHHQPLHEREVPPALRVATRHALLSYAAKHWPAWQFRLLAGVVTIEALVRRVAARWRGDAQARSAFCTLGRLVRDVAHGRALRARRRLGQLLNHADSAS